MKFSIITPSYNQGHFIEETIQSVLSQEVQLEYWVIDGGSTDNTVEILKKYKKSHKNFHYLSEPDRCHMHAINKGLEKCSGDIVAYLNSDDMYMPNVLQMVEKTIKRESGFDWFYGRSVIVNSTGKPILPFFLKVKNFLGKKYSYKKLLSFNIISQPATFFRKSIFESYGDFIEKNIAFDYEYWLRIGKMSPGFPITENLAKFRYHQTSTTGSNFIKLYWEELNIAYKYAHKIFDLPFLITHCLHFCLVVLWTKYLTKY